MLDEALRIEDMYLSYKDLGGTAFAEPRAISYFDKTRSAPENTLIENANLKIKLGETICIGGPSGQGKSAILRAIAGLTRPTKGRFFYFGEYIPLENLTALEVAKRQVGLIFQNGALISNLRVYDNIALPLRYHKMGSSTDIDDKVKMAMDLMRVRDQANLFPHQLSGGLQKRVAIARSWAMDPKLLLMDEPTAGLDNYNRRNLLPLIDNMRSLFKTSIIIVTHDLPLAKELGCNLVFLRKKTLSPPHSYNYWLNTEDMFSKELFRDLRS